MKIIKIKKAGFIFIFLTIFLGFAGINTGNNLIYLITSTLLGFMAISGFFGKQNIEQLEIDISFPDEVYANIDFPLKILIKNNRNFLPAFLIKVKILNKDIVFPFIDTNTSVEKIINIKLNKRGLYKIENLYISSTFPYNFFIRYKKIKKSFEKLVFPQPIKSNIINNFLVQRDNLHSFKNFSNEKGFDGELLYLRDYNQNDSLKLIHWKVSAKKDKLIVKEISSEIKNSLIIDFNNIKFIGTEKKLSAITHFLITLHKKGFKILLKIDGKILKEKYIILKTLALYNENN